MVGGIREQRRAFWRDAVQDWARSGLSKAAYAREHGLAAYQLGQWASRIPTPCSGFSDHNPSPEWPDASDRPAGAATTTRSTVRR